MTPEQRAVNTIKCLGMDAVQQANSGHPGMVMGMADIATVLWSEFVKYDPNDAHWMDRDRVILSNGHGSMLLYAALHLSGQSISLEDIQNFRQWGAVTAGHPEYGYADGIETTTGPLGQGFANGVGMAMAERWLRENVDSELVDHHIYVMTGDGCLMEGVSAEAASLAGHLKLGKLIVLYDDNNITIDGRTDIAFGEDVCARFEAYGWQTLRIDGHDRDAIRQAIQAGKDNAKQPTLIACKTIIAKDAPTKANTSSSHGAPLGEEEIRGAKRTMGMNPDEKFVVHDDAYAHFRKRHGALSQQRASWDAKLSASEHGATLQSYNRPADTSAVDWPIFEEGASMATRNASQAVIKAIAAGIPNFIGGSADLAGSNKTKMPGGDCTGESFAGGRTIHFGVREHGMAAICNGLILHGGVHPFCATFLVFHDYMRPSVRLSALMHQPLNYVYTHDSIFVGEDGPTHQPIEQIESMRLIPNLWVMRPADANESSVMWRVAMERQDGPNALCFTRQNLPVLNPEVAQQARRGGYILRDFEGDSTQRCVLVATGSEVSLALQSVDALESEGWNVRVVSMPCRELFMTQSQEYRASVLPSGVPMIAVEAGVRQGWTGFGAQGALGLDRFGASAPGHIVAEKLGLHVKGIVQQVQQNALK